MSLVERMDMKMTQKLTATKPTRSLFMYPGYLRVVVLAAITVDTSEFVCANVGVSTCSLSTAIRSNAVLSSVTTQSHCIMSRFKVNIELYG